MFHGSVHGIRIPTSESEYGVKINQLSCEDFDNINDLRKSICTYFILKLAIQVYKTVFCSKIILPSYERHRTNLERILSSTNMNIPYKVQKKIIKSHKNIF